MTRSFAHRSLHCLGYGLVALPVHLAGIALTLVGAGRAGAALHATASGLLGVAGRPSGWRMLACLPVDSMAFVLAATPPALLVGRGLLYPVWYAGDENRLDWGGPTLVGRWAAHVGVGMLTVALALIVLCALGAVAARILAAGSRPAAGWPR